MTPYYKLAKNWATQNQNFLMIGPEGLVSIFGFLQPNTNAMTSGVFLALDARLVSSPRLASRLGLQVARVHAE